MLDRLPAICGMVAGVRPIGLLRKMPRATALEPQQGFVTLTDHQRTSIGWKCLIYDLTNPLDEIKV